MKKIGLNIIAVLFSLSLMAQGENAQGDLFSRHLKIYVSVAVLGIILCCILFFLFSMERRLKQLEGKQK